MTRVEARPLLVFDGDCAFCTSSVNWLERRVKRSPHVVAWQHADLAELGLTAEACEEAVQWVGVDGSVHSAERAVGHALVHGGKGWWVLGRLILLPGVRWVAGLVYRWTARNRHRLPGGTPACSLPRPPDQPAAGTSGGSSTPTP